MNLFKLIRSLKPSKPSISNELQINFDEQNRIVDKIYSDLSSMFLDVAITAHLKVYDVHSYAAARLLSSHLPYTLGCYHLDEFTRLYPGLNASTEDTIDYVTGLISDVNVVQEVNAGIRLCIMRHLKTNNDVYKIVEGVLSELIQGNLTRRQTPCSID